MGLYERIKDRVLEQCGSALDTQFKHVVVFAGNGLSRSAAALSGVADPSWHKWIAESLRTVGIEQDLDYLRSLNYSLDHIFSFLIKQGDGKERKVWKELWNATTKIRPSPVHSAILQLTRDVVTTNYDCLFELGSRSLNLGWESVDLIAKRSTDRELNSGTIWKLHGSFPEPSLSDSEKRNDEIFDDWFNNQGPNDTVATAKTYEEWGLIASHDVFVKQFNKVVELLRRESTLVVFLGAGLGAEELIITRVLLASGAPNPSRRWIALEPHEELDPLYRLERRRITPIKVPIGLCGGRFGRHLAMLALLECLVERYSVLDTEDKKRFVVTLRERRHDGFPRSVFNDSLVDSLPVVVSIGQSSVNQMLGLERGVAQETAYAAKLGDWAPGKPDARPLVSFEVGGQALIPALLWDALGIPCALASRVYSDEFGRSVLRRLQETTWLDFSGVKQLPKPPGYGSQIPATDHVTVATWFGIRTLLDTRVSAGELDLDGALLEGHPSVVYVTKRGWEQLKLGLDARKGYDPLIVFETGGIGNVQAEAWIASRKGIVIASAVSALAWMNRYVEEAITSDPADARAIEAARSQWRDQRSTTETKDDRGRLFQTKEVLFEIRKTPRPKFLESVLSGLQLYAVTLGELGMIYWIEGDEHPKWCASIPLFADPPADPIPNCHVRNGAECGDITRAGFVAALLLLSYGNPTSPVPHDHLDRAVAWANWFGACKLQFFSLDDYMAVIKTNSKKLVEKIRRAELPGLGGAAGVHNVDFKVEQCTVGSSLHPQLEAWIATTENYRSDDRKLWEEKILEWAKDRGFRK